jgi:8-oxo-dGTP diphosphatase
MTQPNEEVKALAQRWGQPRLITKQIPVAPGLKAKMVHDFFSDRWGEVMMVIRRASDGLVWVMTKESFPQGLYSLPTGGIRHREPISAALQRELREETSFEAQLQRFLAVIRYVPVLAPGDPQEVPGFVSYVFLLEERSGDDPVVTSGEKILDFKAVAPRELLDIARQWRELWGSSDAFHDLAAWGSFRSIAHQIVGEALTSRGEEGGE